MTSIKELEKKLALLEEKLNNTEKYCQLYKAKYDQSVQAYDQLLFAFKQFQRRQFGQKSERFLDPNIGQVDMFSSVPAQPLGNEDDDFDPEPTPSSGTHKKRKSSKKANTLLKISRGEK